MLVYDVADTDVRTDFESPCEGNRTVAATRPVVVFHVSAVHLHYAAARVDDCRSVDYSVVESHHHRSCLENRAWLEQVADSMVLSFGIVALAVSFHVDDGFHVAGLHFHHDGYSHVGTYVLQHVYEASFCQVLHAHVDGCNDVGAVDRRRVCDVEKLVHHLAAVLDAVLTS